MSPRLWWLPPLAVFAGVVLYVVCAVRLGWSKWGDRLRFGRWEHASAGSREHSARAYTAFQVLLAISVPVLGAIGYLKLEKYAGLSGPAYAAVVGLAWFEYLASIFVVFAVTRHLMSKWERWIPYTKRRDVKRFLSWVETWMVVFAIAVSVITWWFACVWPGAPAPNVDLTAPRPSARYLVTEVKLDSLVARLDSLSHDGWLYKDWMKRKECLNDGRVIVLLSRDSADSAAAAK